MVVTLAALALTALTLTGCGGASTAGGSGHADPALKMARCMRAHGVPNFPDPSPGAGLVIPNGINADAPAFQNAQRTCNKLLPGNGPGAKPSERARLAMLAMARCIRAHGVPSFPDPTATPPTRPAQRAALALGRGGLFLVVSDPDAPAFKHAAAICHFPMPHPPSG
ncbi:MAG: hypothetical protein ACRDPM_10520 [Solirubrobacteraceae bacterium]